MADYKHRSKIEFRGLTYVYDKTSGEWHLKSRATPRITMIPKAIYSQSLGNQHYWYIPGSDWRAGSPTKVLEIWREKQLEARQLKLEELATRLLETQNQLRSLRSQDWRPKATPADKPRSKKSARRSPPARNQGSSRRS